MIRITRLKREQGPDEELNVNDVIEFCFSEKRRERIRVSIRDGKLYVNGDDIIVITPSASNTVSIELK